MNRTVRREKELRKALREEEFALRRQREREKAHEEARPARHFIVLPGRAHKKARQKWERVRIGGVEDEVAAHCGLFIRAQNLEYNLFVERVAGVVERWCRNRNL